MTSLVHRLRPFILACALLALAAAPALGHAELEESDPPDGGSIERTPYTLVARFGPDMLDPARSRIVVRNATGEQVAEGGALEDDAFTMAVELPPLPAGAYIARWTAVAADGHIERGSIDFTVEQAPATPSPAVTPSPTGPSGGSPTPTAGPTATATPGATVTPVPTPTAPPEPGTGEPAAAELLAGLLVAGLLVGALVFVLLRRRP